LEDQCAEALEQRVVDLTAEPRAFGGDKRKFVPDRPDPEPPQHPASRCRHENAESVKPHCPIEWRKHRESHLSVTGRPYAVCGDRDMEAIAAGLEVCEGNLPTGTGIDPFIAEAVEAIAESQLRRRREADRAVLDLEHACTRGHDQIC